MKLLSISCWFVCWFHVWHLVVCDYGKLYPRIFHYIHLRFSHYTANTIIVNQTLDGQHSYYIFFFFDFFSFFLFFLFICKTQTSYIRISAKQILCQMCICELVCISPVPICIYIFSYISHSTLSLVNERREDEKKKWSEVNSESFQAKLCSYLDGKKIVYCQRRVVLMWLFDCCCWCCYCSIAHYHFIYSLVRFWLLCIEHKMWTKINALWFNERVRGWKRYYTTNNAHETNNFQFSIFNNNRHHHINIAICIKWQYLPGERDKAVKFFCGFQFDESRKKNWW